MRFLKPLLALAKKPSQAKAAHSFGEKRATALNRRYTQAVEERKKLARAQYVATDDLQKVYEHRGQQLDRTIARLQNERKSTSLLEDPK